MDEYQNPNESFPGSWLGDTVQFPESFDDSYQEIEESASDTEDKVEDGVIVSGGDVLDVDMSNYATVDDIARIVSDSAIAPLNLSINENMLNLFDRIVSGSNYRYYYLYSTQGSPTNYYLYLFNRYVDGQAKDGLLLTYTYTSGSGTSRYYLNRSTFSTYSPSLGSDLCYTNVVPNYPILADSPYADRSLGHGVMVAVIIFVVFAVLKILFSSRR